MKEQNNENTIDFIASTNDNALLAYIDLLGTKQFYEHSSLKDQVERLYKAMFEIFSGTFDTSLQGKRIGKDDFYINIYADSILMAQRKRDSALAKTLLDFLLSYQWELTFDGGLPNNRPVPVRNINLKKPLFFPASDHAACWFHSVVKVYFDKPLRRQRHGVFGRDIGRLTSWGICLGGGCRRIRP